MFVDPGPDPTENRVELRSGWHLRASDGEARLWRASGDRGAEGWARACDDGNPSARRRKAGAAEVET